MERMKYSVSKRTVAMLLSIVMVLSMLPVMNIAAAVVQENSQVTDNSTMDSWTSFFSPENITTSHAGGVWTDKSVFKDNASFAGMTVGANNFLVALSALGSNSVVMGQTSAPADTMFVLDVSNSMSDTALRSMVTATNNAIRTLLAGENNNNRVGVVLYGTSANVLLPLDHYTGITIDGVETFIQLNGSSIRAARSGQSRIKDGNNQNFDNSVSTGGGTYTQGGLWKAWEEFEDASVDADAAVKRSPVMVLMCDGAATYSAADFDDVPDSASHGSGSSSGIGDGFVTQLTAAYVKAKMAEKYGTDAFFYTLGLDVEDIAIAQAILDPANKNAATSIDDEWDDFITDGSATVSMYRRGWLIGSNVNTTITNDTAGTLASPFTSESYKYVDKYFSANQASDLNQQFQNVVNEISLSTGYYPTHLDASGSNYSGYITFVDALGRGMEVKEIEGVVLGEKVYTGQRLAEALINGAFGTKEAPTALGDEFVWSVRARLGLQETDEIWALLDYSYNVRKSLHYNSADDWSNYIVWYGDADGNYLGYDAALEATAAYRNVCYGMLGTADEVHQVADMMYVGIQVSTELATGDQTVTFRVPASVLPVVTYQISVEGDAITGGTEATLTYHKADPIRLVYEVGVKDEINEFNVSEYATPGGDGKYYLYTNKWNENPDLSDTNANDLTYAYFEPGADNEHYYFTEDSVIYTDMNKRGTVGNANDLNVNGTYYYEHYVFNQVRRNQDGTFSVRADAAMEKLSEDALKEAKEQEIYQGGKLCVPKGTMHFAHSHDLYKGAVDHTATQATANKTETFPYVREQIVNATVGGQAGGAKHYELVYLGNNGRLQVNPATGISITKQVDETITDADAVYTFVINVSKANHDLLEGTFTQKNGDAEQDITFVNGSAEVTLKAGEIIYIYDLPVGAIYEISERYGDGYKQSVAVGDTGAVAGGKISAATFTNTKRGTGSLSIEKDVTDHPFTTAEIESVDFDFVVELTRADGSDYSGTVSVIKSGDASVQTLTVVNGKAAFTLHDNQELTLLNLPEGITYTVYEVDADNNKVAINATARPGYKLVSVAGGTNSHEATGTIAEGAVGYAHFVNKYEATPITPVIYREIIKNIVASDGVVTPAGTYKFEISLVGTDDSWYSSISLGAGETTKTNGNTSLGVNPGEAMFYSVGTYQFLVHELTPAGTVEDPKIPGMTYDAKRASFTVVVTDENMDGQLEWHYDTDAFVNANLKEGTTDTVQVVFNNIYDEGSVTATFHAKKNLENNTGIDIPLTGFRFGLYSDEACTVPAFDGTDPTNPRSQFTAGPGGLVDIKVHITRNTINNASSAELVYYLKEIVPAEQMVGMTYDPTVYKVTVSVTDANDVLSVDEVKVEPVSGNSQADGTTAVFNNKYQVQSVNVTLSGDKEFTGRGNNTWLDSDSFTFELYKTDATFHRHEGDTPLKTAVADAGNKGYTFALDSFTQVGIYHYVVVERHGGMTFDGVTYDATEYHVTVTVALDETVSTAAKLKADVAVVKLGSGNVGVTELDFVNTYSVAPIDVTLGGTKQVRNETQGSSIVISPAGYQFMLRKDNSAGALIETVTSGASGSFTFKPLHFTAPGEYVYEIVEVGAGATVVNGVHYNAANWRVKVTVTDNNDGTMSYAISTVDHMGSSTFINTYVAQATKLGLTGIKELVGAEGTDRPLQADEFGFTLKPVGDAPMPEDQTSVTVKNDANGRITFPDITFDAVGVYQYTITEEKEEDGTDGIYYDKVVYTVTVDVTDNGTGKLVARVTQIKGDETVKRVIDFYNGYYAAPVNVTISGNKVLENKTPGIAAGTTIPLTGENLSKFPFSFVIGAVTSGAPMPDSTTVQSGENGAISFGAITFDAVGEYKYTVKEVIPEGSNGVLNGVSYTVQTHNITITVTDDQKGALVAEVKLGDDVKSTGTDDVAAQILSFKNTYTAATSNDVVLGGTKELENITAGMTEGTTIELEGGEFTFKLEAVTPGAPMPEGTGNVATNAAGGAFRFGALTFHALGEYKYKISEVSDPVKGYITYADPVTVTVAVTDNDLDGVLETSVTYGSESSLTVTNKYAAAETKLALTGTKDMDTRDPREGEFEFMLTAVNGAPMPGREDTVYTKNDASGKILFPEITYDTVGEYKYTIKEVTAPDGYEGVTYDKAVYDVTVTVTDGGAGKLLAVAKSVKQGESTASDVVFFNKYQAAPVVVSFEGVKTLAGRKLVDGEFTFLLTDEDGKVLDTVQNKDGKIVFEDQTLTAAGTYKFFIKEDTSAAKEGITYDEKVQEVTIEVRDDGFGQLKAYIGQTQVESVGFSFTNIFTPEDAKAEITVQKELQNLCDKPMGLDGFQFLLEDADGQKTVQASDEEGIAKFLLSFSAADAGKTFTYRLTEVNTEVKGVSYSAAVYEVKVTVTKDEVTGKLSAAVSVTKDGAAYEGNPGFVNVYNLEEPPKMGDETDLAGMSLCMGISTVGLLAVLVLGRKKKEFSAE